MKETVLLLLDHDHQEIKMERAASIGKTLKGTSPSGDKEQPPCQKYLKETCTDPSCDCWHAPDCVKHEAKEGCS